jgi:hypothetical protein
MRPDAATNQIQTNNLLGKILPKINSVQDNGEFYNLLVFKHRTYLNSWFGGGWLGGTATLGG